MALNITRRPRQGQDTVTITVPGPDGEPTVITVQLTEVASSKKVHLSFTAPPDVQIWRNELLTKQPG